MRLGGPQASAAVGVEIAVLGKHPRKDSRGRSHVLLPRDHVLAHVLARGLDRGLDRGLRRSRDQRNPSRAI